MYPLIDSGRLKTLLAMHNVDILLTVSIPVTLWIDSSIALPVILLMFFPFHWFSSNHASFGVTVSTTWHILLLQSIYIDLFCSLTLSMWLSIYWESWLKVWYMMITLIKSLKATNSRKDKSVLNLNCIFENYLFPFIEFGSKCKFSLAVAIF